MSAIPDEKTYRDMVSEQSADRFGVGRAVASFCRVAGLDERGFQRVFLVGGGPDHLVGIDTAGDLAAPIFELPRAGAGLRRIDPEAQAKLVNFLVEHREVMSYTP